MSLNYRGEEKCFKIDEEVGRGARTYTERKRGRRDGGIEETKEMKKRSSGGTNCRA